jgi:hypothetical protein
VFEKHQLTQWEQRRAATRFFLDGRDMGLYARAFKGWRENIWHLPCVGGEQLNWRSA